MPLLLAAGPCLAQPAPRTTPDRDVDIVYLITRGSQQLQERSRFQAATGRQRVDVAGTGSYMISDRRAGLVDMVNDTARQVVEMHVAPSPGDTGAGFTQVGQQAIDGIACTDFQAPGPSPAVLCLTADGVTLGMAGQQGQSVRAVSVSYAPADAAAFVVPAEYSKSVPGAGATAP